MTNALITKYRPSKFSEVVGQAAVVRSLEASLKKGSSQMYLLSGQPGTGKTTLARLIANAVGCLERDRLEIDGVSKTGVEDMRAVVDSLLYRPIGDGKIKVVIVDEAQGLSKASITSLLKVTEEPPPHVMWILCTTEPTRIPEALRTRATHYSLKPVGFDDLVRLLDKVVAAEKIDPDETVVDLCAAEAGGSPRQALANLAVCAAARDITEAKELLRSALESEEAIALARALVNGASWSDVQKILLGLKEVGPESIRHVVRAYVSSMILNAKKEAVAGRGLTILDAFSIPCNPADGLSPIILATGKVILGA